MNGLVSLVGPCIGAVPLCRLFDLGPLLPFRGDLAMPFCQSQFENSHTPGATFSVLGPPSPLYTDYDIEMSSPVTLR